MLHDIDNNNIIFNSVHCAHLNREDIAGNVILFSGTDSVADINSAKFWRCAV